MTEAKLFKPVSQFWLAKLSFEIYAYAGFYKWQESKRGSEDLTITIFLLCSDCHCYYHFQPYSSEYSL